MSRKLTKALRQQKQATQQVPQEIYGTMFAIDGLVEVLDRPSFVYVQLRDNQNEIIQAFNNKVSASPGLPVIVHREGNRYIIQGVNTQRYQNNWNNYSPYLPKHGTAHSFADGGGGDVAWIFSRQFMPNLVYPNDGGTTGTSAYIAPHILLNNAGVWTYTGATGTQNLLGYKGTGSSSAMLLIYLDANTGNPGILVGSGSYFPNTLTGTATIYPYIPVPNQATQIPLAAVRMDTGTANITWDNLYDVRQWIHALPSGTSSSIAGGGSNGFAGLSKGIPLGTGTMLNVDGSRLTFGISGTMFHLSNSPDPQELIGIYGMSGTVGLGTGTSLSFSRGILVSITGTTLYAQVDFGTASTQVASGDRGVTSGDNHNHELGAGATILLDNQSIADTTNLNSSLLAHGFLSKLSGNANEYMNGTGSWSVPNYPDLTNKPTAETNSNDIFNVATPGGPSLWTGTINGAPAGTSVTVSAPATGTEAVLVPTSTSQLAKMRLYNLTRGNSALISNYNVGTNVVTLTATVPANWANGDSLTVASQTVSGGGFNWVDLEITSILTGKSSIFVKSQITSATALDSIRIHPTETFDSSKLDNLFVQVANQPIPGFALIKLTSNVFSITWTGTPSSLAIRESGYL